MSSYPAEGNKKRGNRETIEKTNRQGRQTTCPVLVLLYDTLALHSIAVLARSAKTVANLARILLSFPCRIYANFKNRQPAHSGNTTFGVATSGNKVATNAKIGRFRAEFLEA